jgi:hypothetical protein
MDKSQLGRAGELALTLYALVTSDGQVELFSPVVDNDHVDLVAGIRGGLPALGIQVKTSDELDRDGLVEARASYPAGQLRDDSAFIYAVVLLDSISIQAVWIIPSPDFNRLTYRTATEKREVEFRASPVREDSFSAFRIDPLSLGMELFSRITAAPSAPDWLRSLVSAAAD